MRLKGTVAFVTGGAGSIGRAIALLLAKKGISVAIADLNENASCNVADEAQRLGGVALGVGVDVTRKADVAEAVYQVKERLGNIDILVNCAGIYSHSFVVEMGEEEWDAVVNVNLKGTFLTCQAVIPNMQRMKFGKIVNISSGHGFKGGKKAAHYSASKAGVVVFTKSLALELAPYKINVNCVAPGITDTEMPRRVMSEEEISTRARTNPMGRIGAPDDIADAVLFLISEESRYITGQTIYVNGGDLMPS
ncbi:MAG: SDR family oxidoreductase [Methanomassiliicoccales archaeon]|nr:MAG: SDR family oxidoreductase [Methanomassiliicoccales archaeon]